MLDLNSTLRVKLHFRRKWRSYLVGEDDNTSNYTDGSEMDQVKLQLSKNWNPGHRNIFGNEKADKLAKLGASTDKSEAVLI